MKMLSFVHFYSPAAKSIHQVELYRCQWLNLERTRSDTSHSWRHLDTVNESKGKVSNIVIIQRNSKLNSPNRSFVWNSWFARRFFLPLAVHSTENMNSLCSDIHNFRTIHSTFRWTFAGWLLDTLPSWPNGKPRSHRLCPIRSVQTWIQSLPRRQIEPFCHSQSIHSTYCLQKWIGPEFLFRI